MIFTVAVLPLTSCCWQYRTLQGYHPTVIYPRASSSSFMQSLIAQCGSFSIPVEQHLPNPIPPEFSYVVDGFFGFSFKPPVSRSLINRDSLPSFVTRDLSPNLINWNSLPNLMTLDSLSCFNRAFESRKAFLNVIVLINECSAAHDMFSESVLFC